MGTMWTMRTRIVLFLSFLAPGCAADSPRDQPATLEPSFDEVVACNDSAVGGDELRRIQSVEYDLRIREPSFEVDATYSAHRSGIARIDILSDGVRVFSEGWEGAAGWQLPQGATEPEPTSEVGGAALRHGLEQPGHLWTLADMRSQGHDLVEDRDAEASPDERVAHLTLTDGFESWYWIDTGRCLVTRKRDFRAFHPDADPEETWIETRFDDYRTTEGVTRAWATYAADLTSGDTIAITRVRAVRTTFDSLPGG